MALIDILRRPFTGKAATIQQGGNGVQVPGISYTQMWERRSLSPRTDYPEWLKMYKANAAVQGCVNALALTLPEAPISERRGEDLITDTDFLRILKGAGMSEQQLMMTTATHVGIGGNCYWHKRKTTSGRYVSVFPYSDEFITPIPDDNGDVDVYRYVNGTTVIDIPKEEIVHIRGFWVDPQRPWMGASPIGLGTASIESYNTAQETVNNIFANDATPPTVLAYKDELSPDQAALVKATFQRANGGQKRGSVGVLSGDVQMLRIGLGLDDLALGETFGVLETRICSIYRVDPIIAMTYAGMQNSSYANFETAYKTFTSLTRVPLWTLIAGQIATGFRNEYPDLVVEFDTTNVQALQPDPNVARTSAVTAFAAGIIDRNEAREVFGLSATDAPTNAPTTPTNDTAKSKNSLETKSAGGWEMLSDSEYYEKANASADTRGKRIEKRLSATFAELQREVLSEVKSRRGMETKKKPFDVKAWTEKFLKATEEERKILVEKILADAAEEVGANWDDIESAFGDVRGKGIDESASKIKESVETVHEELKTLLRDLGNADAATIEDAINAKFSTYQGSRSATIARTTVTATTGVSQKEAWDKMNEDIDDPTKKIVRKWVAIPGQTSRHSSMPVNGSYEDENGLFTVGSEKTAYPAGSGLSADQAVNCKCFTRAIRAGRKPKQ